MTQQTEPTDAMVEAANALTVKLTEWLITHDALAEGGPFFWRTEAFGEFSDELLQAALAAQQDAEPVAWGFEVNDYGKWVWRFDEFEPTTAFNPNEVRNVRPLYTHPAPDDGWMPIESAPKDGTRIIVAEIGWCYSSEAIKKWPGDLEPKDEYRVFWASSAKYDALRERWTDGLEALRLPSHWQRLDTPTPSVGPNGCDGPPSGWYCTREHGHEGSCAALPKPPATQGEG